MQEGEPDMHFNLAQALLATGGERDQALAEARTARDQYRETGARTVAELAEVERWLDRHDRGPR